MLRTQRCQSLFQLRERERRGETHVVDETGGSVVDVEEDEPLDADAEAEEDKLVVLEGIGGRVLERETDVETADEDADEAELEEELLGIVVDTGKEVVEREEEGGRVDGDELPLELLNTEVGLWLVLVGGTEVVIEGEAEVGVGLRSRWSTRRNIEVRRRVNVPEYRNNIEASERQGPCAHLTCVRTPSTSVSTASERVREQETRLLPP